MYNPEIKQRFIEEVIGSSKSKLRVCKHVFNAFEKFENQWGADLCTRSEKELRDVLWNVVGLRAKGQMAGLIVLKDYVKWCLATGVPGACDAMLNINVAGIEKIKHQTVANPRHLQAYMNAVFDPESKLSNDNIFRCYYWLAYSGVEEQDIFEIKCSDVDFRNMIIRYDKKATVVPMYRESIEAFHNCADLDSFKYYHPNYRDVIVRNRVEGDTLIRGVRAKQTYKSMRDALSRKVHSETNVDKMALSYYRVWISGEFYRMYEDEIAGIEPNFLPIAIQRKRVGEYNLSSCRNTQENKLKQIVNEYMKDYDRWKLAWR